MADLYGRLTKPDNLAPIQITDTERRKAIRVIAGAEGVDKEGFMELCEMLDLDIELMRR